MPGQRYAVYRIVLDKDVREDIPMFVITEKSSTLDSVTTYHRFEKQAQEQVRTTKGAVAVLELHCYSVPDELPDEQIRSSFMAELHHFFPELAGAKLLWEHLQLKRDFTAFHVNQHEHRPTTDTGVSGLYCAGDWVKLPFSAMLLEGACASGIHAANAILAEDGLRSEPLYAVPHRGVLAGMPTPPARQRLYRAS
jgi:isorenieratene synthase